MVDKRLIGTAVLPRIERSGVSQSNLDALPQRLRALSVADPNYAIRFVDTLLDAACAAQASDVHVQPTAPGMEIRWRLDGVLQSIGTFPRGETTDVVARLKVLAELLTYRTDVPQEGRLRERHGNVEIRVSTFPTLHGERAVIRLFALTRPIPPARRFAIAR